MWDTHVSFLSPPLHYGLSDSVLEMQKPLCQIGTEGERGGRRERERREEGGREEGGREEGGREEGGGREGGKDRK